MLTGLAIAEHASALPVDALLLAPRRAAANILPRPRNRTGSATIGPKEGCPIIQPGRAAEVERRAQPADVAVSSTLHVTAFNAYRSDAADVSGNIWHGNRVDGCIF